MKRLALVVLVLALALSLTGCGGSTTASDANSSSIDYQAPTATPARSYAPTPTPTPQFVEESQPATADAEPEGCSGRPAGVICWTEGAYYAGQQVTVQGKVVTAYDSGNAIFLDFDPDYQKWLYVLIWPEFKQRFPGGDPVGLYEGRVVLVTGTIVMYKGTPEIIVESPDQIQIVR
jgi:hypothetical protein